MKAFLVAADRIGVLHPATLLCISGMTNAALARPPASLTARITIEVPAAGRSRPGDRMPARVRLDFGEVFRDPAARIDPRSLRLYRLGRDGDSPKPAGRPIPVRFDDPDPKPDSFHHHFLGGGGQRGDLVFEHSATAAEPARYLLIVQRWSGPPERIPAGPAPPIGDYDILRYPTGPMSGIFHTKITVADWNGDGRPDILAGDTLGYVTLYERSAAQGFEFQPPRLLRFGPSGSDLGWMVAPDAVDWDGDGNLDLLLGVDGGKLLLARNVGSRTDPQLAAPIAVSDVDGEPIVTPHAPCPELPFLKRDYLAMPDAADYDGDGDVDLLVGGYVTGLIYLYENTGGTADGWPKLVARGVLRTDDGPIDVTWHAAPELADLDGDGDLDLIVGQIAEDNAAFGWSSTPSARYFENVGSRSAPRWRERPSPMPNSWTPFPPDVTVPRLADWDGDGDLDLLLSGRCEVFYFENAGSRNRPRFEFVRRVTMRNGPLLCAYVLSAVAPCVGDLNGDGLPDLLRGGGGSIPWAEMVRWEDRPVFRDRGLLQAADEPIVRTFALGDDTTFPFLFDWDADARIDLVLGDGAGYVLLYRNVGTPTQHRFEAGRMFRTSDGRPLCVGKPPPSQAGDFASHSGNRAVPAPGDYDGDGRPDLICGNADGDVFFYRGAGGMTVEPGVRIAHGANRCFTWPVDWNSDGRLDVILCWAGGRRAIYLNQGPDAGGVPQFTARAIANMPWFPYPRPMAIDWNRDGDIDIVFASSYGLLHFAERDFIEHGYVEARVVQIEVEDGR